MKKTLFLFIIAIVSLACSTEKEIKPGDIIRLSEPTVTLYEQEVDTQPLQETAISVEVIEGTTLWDIAEYATGSGWNWEVLFHMNNMSPSRLYYRDRGYGREPMVRLSIGEEIFIPSHWKTTLPVSVRPISTFDVVVNYVPTNLNLLVQGNVGKAYVRAPHMIIFLTKTMLLHQFRQNLNQGSPKTYTSNRHKTIQIKKAYHQLIRFLMIPVFGISFGKFWFYCG